MDRYVVPTEPSSSNPKPIRRPRWRRTAIELNGCMESKYKREMCGLLVQSYSQIGVFTHLYHIDGRPCRTHMDRVLSFAGMDIPLSSRRHGISALEFDNQGIYVASVTKSGCLMVHEFESLYCQSNVISPWWKEDETKHLLHISTSRQLDSVRWNSANQDEVACASLKSSEILIYDIGYVSSDPVDILKKRPSVTIHGSDIITGLSDVAFTSTDDSRVFASDTNGSINIWDRRGSTFPSVQLTTNSSTALNSIQLNVDNQIVFGAGKQGMIYMWDLRGGRTSAAFQNHKEAYHPPMASVKVSSLLEKIEILKAQSHIVPKDIHSINLDPSSPYRLAFHLDDVGSSSDKGLHLLDFHPDPGSPCHVDCSEEMANISRRNGFVPLSEDVSACAAHPLNGFIVAGTKQASLLMIGQRKKAVQGDEEGLLTHQDNE